MNQMSVLRERGETVGDYLAQQMDAEIAPEAKRILAFLDKKQHPLPGDLAGYARLVEADLTGIRISRGSSDHRKIGPTKLWDAAKNREWYYQSRQKVTSTFAGDLMACGSGRKKWR